MAINLFIFPTALHGTLSADKRNFLQQCTRLYELLSGAQSSDDQLYHQHVINVFQHHPTLKTSIMLCPHWKTNSSM